MELNRLFDMMDQVQEKATVGAVFGPPTRVKDKTLIPIGRVAYGLGLGFGRGAATTTLPAEAPESAGASGGGGLSIHPLAVLEVTPEATTLKPIVDNDRIAKMGMFVGGWCVFWLARALIKIFGKK